MVDSISISQEQADLLEAGIQPAIESVLETGNFFPTLYLHDGKEIVLFTIAVSEVEELRTLSRTTILDKCPDALAYVLIYDSDIETEEGMRDALIVETGDAEDDGGHEFAKWYIRESGEYQDGFYQLGPVENLLK